jgi:hypothetical protein
MIPVWNGLQFIPESYNYLCDTDLDRASIHTGVEILLRHAPRPLAFAMLFDGVDGGG